MGVAHMRYLLTAVVLILFSDTPYADDAAQGRAALTELPVTVVPVGVSATSVVLSGGYVVMNSYAWFFDPKTGIVYVCYQGPGISSSPVCRGTK